MTPEVPSVVHLYLKMDHLKLKMVIYRRGRNKTATVL